MDIKEILEKQKKYYRSGITLAVPFRIAMLKRLYAEIAARTEEIEGALKEDLGKSSYESYMCEIGMVLSEIRHMIRHTKKYAASRRVHTPLSQFAAVSYEKPVPYGNVLVMSPWNYPFLLTMDPLANALAAGNTVVLKPSAYAPSTGRVMQEIIGCCFPPEYVAVVTGGRRENAALLEQRFDFIFFTGSQAVGREVLRRAAEDFIPVVLELGGKSPCIVDRSAKLELAARRIVFGKYLNCGQTCVAPDYILCSADIKDRLIREICAQIELQFGRRPLENVGYGKIINEKHFRRILGLIDGKKVVWGGGANPQTLQIEPTVMDHVSWSDAVMQEEIFGPVLPVLTYEEFDEIIPLLSDKPKPLALYLFTEDREQIQKATERIAFGGGCVNDTIIHLATSEMGFGGVGESGMGAYHGRVGFEAFSHIKSIVDKKTWIDLPVRYQPYKDGIHARMLRRMLR